MNPLDRKLFRDLRRMWLNTLAIALVLGCGLSVFIMALGMRGSLQAARVSYYEAQRMADIEVTMVRAPKRAASEIARVTGVTGFEPRITGFALLDIADLQEPASALLVSLPSSGRPAVNDLVLRRGRWPDPARPKEVLLSEAFSDAVHLDTGSRLEATLRGRRETFLITGIANSPEFVFIAAPGELFPQPERFGVVWMSEDALQRAFDLEGAFNNAVIRLAPGTNPRRTIAAVDRLLAPYGASGAHGRDRMLSDRFLSEEIRQLATMAVFLPSIFILIAAFLISIALGRMIQTERSNIGLLKAFGFTSTQIAWHYAKLALILALLGTGIGTLGGVLLGAFMAGVYQNFYRFPELHFSPSAWIFVFAALMAVLAAASGAMVSVWRAARLAPAEALSAPRPASFGRKGKAPARSDDWLDAKSRIILRRILRFPRRSATTVIGIGLAIALLVVARTFPAVMDRLMDVQFATANRQDITLTFSNPQEKSVVHDLVRLPGVQYAEAYRVDSVILKSGGHRVEEAVWGLTPRARLSQVTGAEGQAIAMPAEGVLLARALAEKLQVSPGNAIEIEQTSGRRQRTSVRVAGIADPMIGSSAYMRLDRLDRLMREPGRISGAHVRIDTKYLDEFSAAIKETPALASASYLNLAEASMRRNFDEGVGYMNAIYSTFAAIMAGGVAFSAARVTFAEQARDLATLRVLGFTRTEVSYVLVGELFLLALMAVPFGGLTGTVLARWLMALFETDMYDFPDVFNPAGYGYASAFTLICVILAALFVRRTIDRLDLVAVLKARE